MKQRIDKFFMISERGSSIKNEIIGDSISNGIAIGSIAYIVIALLRGKFTKKDIVLAVVSILFIIRFFTVSM